MGTASFKWDKYPEGVLPLWVADMDFVSPPAVVAALRERAAHGVFGYALLPDSPWTQSARIWWHATVVASSPTGWFGCPAWCRASTSPAGRSRGRARP